MIWILYKYRGTVNLSLDLDATARINSGTSGGLAMNNKNRAFCSVSLFVLLIWQSTQVSAQGVATTSGPKIACSSLMGLTLPNTEIISASETSSPSAHCNVV